MDKFKYSVCIVFVMPQAGNDVNYWLTPVKSEDDETSNERIKRMVCRDKIYRFKEKYSTHVKKGDYICFYSIKYGIVADARIISDPKIIIDNKDKLSLHYPLLFKLNNINVYIDNPTIIDEKIRKSLEAFENKNHMYKWQWFIRRTHKVTKNDFIKLTHK